MAPPAVLKMRPYCDFNLCPRWVTAVHGSGHEAAACSSEAASLSERIRMPAALDVQQRQSATNAGRRRTSSPEGGRGSVTTGLRRIESPRASRACASERGRLGLRGCLRGRAPGILCRNGPGEDVGEIVRGSMSFSLHRSMRRASMLNISRSAAT